MDGLIELWWHRDRWEGLHLVMLNKLENGQRTLMGKYDSAPFDGASEAARWLTRELVRGAVVDPR